MKLKTGDLVKISPASMGSTLRWDYHREFGIVIETGQFAGNRDIKVMWSDIGITTEKSKTVVVISEEK